MSAPHTLLIIQNIIVGWVNLLPSLSCLFFPPPSHKMLSKSGQRPISIAMLALSSSELWSAHLARHYKNCYGRMGQTTKAELRPSCKKLEWSNSQHWHACSAIVGALAISHHTLQDRWMLPMTGGHLRKDLCGNWGIVSSAYITRTV